MSWRLSQSNNYSSTNVFSQPYISDLRYSSNVSNYWVTTSSMLSRGEKDVIQRTFIGEPLKNVCNVYIHNETTKDWYHEYTLTGNSSLSGPEEYPPGRITTNGQTLDNITYNVSVGTSYSLLVPGDALKPFSKNLDTSNVFVTAPYYDIVTGSYSGSTTLSGNSGDYIKLEAADSSGNGIEIDRFHLYFSNNYTLAEDFVLLGSNDDTNWTNIHTAVSNWSYIAPTPAVDLGLTYGSYGYSFTKSTWRYLAFVFKQKRADTGLSFVAVSQIEFYNTKPSEDFGRSVAGTDNADIVAVGAPRTWFGSSDNISGSVYVFEKDSTGNGWTQRGSTLSQTGGFGHSVALSKYDGNILVCGAPFYNTVTPPSSAYSVMAYPYTFYEPVSEGKVYIYKWNGTNYILIQTLNSPSGTLSNSVVPDAWKSFYFGYSLDITDIGDKIIIGEPAIRSLWDNEIQGRTTRAGNYRIYEDEFPYTGNAHVYDNVSVLSSGTTWTSNVSITSITGSALLTAGDSTTGNFEDALGTSVSINRPGTRLFVGAPGNHGKVYTIGRNEYDTTWEQMGEKSKDINSEINNSLLGFSISCDGSGRRLISGSPFKNGIGKGIVSIYDWNGDQWVSFPGETVDITSNLVSNTFGNLRFGESVSIDGEGEVISIGKSSNEASTLFPDYGFTAASYPIFYPSRPQTFNVSDITYIGGASTSSTESNIYTGASNIWVYSIQQSMVIKGNVTIGGYVEATGISVGTNDNSTSSKSLFFGGTNLDNAYKYTVIENRVFTPPTSYTSSSELLLFKGKDGYPSEDRIRLKSEKICFDLTSSNDDRSVEDIRIVFEKNSTGSLKCGINKNTLDNVTLDVNGIVKATSFEGYGKNITGVDLDFVVKNISEKTSSRGSTASNIVLMNETFQSTQTFPSTALTSNTSHSEFTCTASFNPETAYKLFDNSLYGLQVFGEDSEYTNGQYTGSVEKIPFYKGHWVEITTDTPIYLETLEIYPFLYEKTALPRILWAFGSNDGIHYTKISTANKSFNWGTDNQFNTVISKTIDEYTDIPYTRHLFILNKVSQQFYAPRHSKWQITAKTSSFTETIKLNNITGDINLTGGLSANGAAGTSGQVLTSSGGGAMSWSTVSGGSSPWTTSGSNIYRSSGQVNIGGSAFTRAKLEINGSHNSALTYRYYAYGSTFGQLASGYNSYSIYANQRIAAVEFNAHSDRRIKKNITDINDSSALDKIRLLEPKIYNYIDEKDRGTSNVYGFIAQEVANVLPYAVTVSEGDIPNILTNSNVSVTSDSNVLELRLDTTVEGLTLSNTSVINIITDKDKDLKCNVLSFSESNVITIENTDEFSNVTNAFIKGEQISDFNHLNKDAIWAVSTAALQEVDRQLQAEKTKVVTLETQVANLLARVTALENT